MRVHKVVLAAAAFGLAASLIAPAAAATRQPCSGKKGGVERCEGGKFVCKDGSKSSSKKMCTG
ncbi:YdcA family protein [Alsobacter sp. R-9]